MTSKAVIREPEEQQDSAAHLLAACLGRSEHERFETQLQPGAWVFREGEHCRAVLFITAGEVELSMGFGADRTVIAVLGAGDVAGLPAAMQNGRSVISGRAVGLVRGYSIPRALLQKAVHQDPKNLAIVSRLLSARVDSALACLRSHRMPRRRITPPPKPLSAAE